MNAHNDESMITPIEQKAFEKAICDTLSPEAVTTIIAFLQPAAHHKPPNAEALAALREVEWFADTLTALVGVEEHNRLLEELGL